MPPTPTCGSGCITSGWPDPQPGPESSRHRYAPSSHRLCPCLDLPRLPYALSLRTSCNGVGSLPSMRPFLPNVLPQFALVNHWIPAWRYTAANRENSPLRAATLVARLCWRPPAWLCNQAWCSPGVSGGGGGAPLGRRPRDRRRGQTGGRLPNGMAHAQRGYPAAACTSLRRPCIPQRV